MNKLDIFKATLGFIVGAGVSTIISSIVDTNVPQENTLQKVVVFSGKTGISMLVSEAVRAHVNTKVDLAADWFGSRVVVSE